MRVLIATGIFPPDIGGPATYSKILSEELPKRGVEVKVITYGKTRHYPWFFRHAVFGLRVFWNARNSDIIFAQDPMNSAVVSWISARFWRKKFVMKVIGDYAWEQGVNRFGVKDLLGVFLHMKYDWRVEFLRSVEKFVAKRTRVVIVPSQYLKSVVERWSVKPSKIKVIYNSVSFLDISKSKEELKRELNLSGRVLVSVGRLVSWKGFEMLVELMPEISEKYPDAELLIIGSGPELEKLQATNYKLQARVNFLGNLSHDQVLKYLKAADIFLLNTGYEGFSHQILEAMASGVPIVSTPAGGNREALEDRKNALVVPYNEKEAWLPAVLELLDSRPFAVELAENARRDVSKFTGKDMIEETLKVLGEI